MVTKTTSYGPASDGSMSTSVDRVRTCGRPRHQGSRYGPAGLGGPEAFV
jgi:hypothetical protein